MKKAVKYLGRFLAALLILLLLYFFAALVGSLIPVNDKPRTAEAGVEIFMRTNGVHTSLVLPLKNGITDWTETVDPAHTPSQINEYNLVSFGWGDLVFYRNTPEWSDLTLPIAFKALFLESPSALNVEFHNLIIEGEDTFSIQISEEEYQKLSDYIRDSFEYDQNGSVQPVPDLHYNKKDVFYRAKRHMNIFYTCNTWTNNALKTSDLRACLWTPFDRGIFYQYR